MTVVAIGEVGREVVVTVEAAMVDVVTAAVEREAAALEKVVMEVVGRVVVATAVVETAEGAMEE